MKSLSVLKFAVGVAVQAGVYKIISDIVDKNTEPKNKVDKVVIFFGKEGLTYLLSDITVNHVNLKLDNAALYMKNTFRKKAINNG